MPTVRPDTEEREVRNSLIGPEGGMSVYGYCGGTASVVYSVTRGQYLIEVRLASGEAAVWEHPSGAFVGFRR